MSRFNSIILYLSPGQLDCSNTRTSIFSLMDSNTFPSATVVCVSVFTVLAIVSLCIHITVSIKRDRRLVVIDFVIIAAFLIALALVAQTLWAVLDEGQGQHASRVSQTHFNLIAKSLLVHEELWALVNTLIRVTACVFLIKVFGQARVSRYILTTVSTFSALHGVSTIIVGALVCRPLNAAWDSTIAGKCINQIAAFVSLEAIGLLIDLIIVIIPIQIIARLNMSPSKKFVPVLVLSGGSVVTVITALRIAALHRVNTADVSYDQAYLGLLSIIGALLSIITSCIPNVRYFFTKDLMNLKAVFHKAASNTHRLYRTEWEPVTRPSRHAGTANHPRSLPHVSETLANDVPKQERTSPDWSEDE
ncbi:hypothetical protein F5Y19DRAFT_486200 [Xylariaceae sp. FL1651]|nr:hypothetical protein F5Y19DRAFT_486200 [Xylariaceae sp. FL1651]